MKAVLIAMASQSRFLESRPAVTPEHASRLQREPCPAVCGDANPWVVNDFLQRSGMGIFDRSMPDGYPEKDEAYADSNAMMQRWRFATQERWSLNRLVPIRGARPAATEQWRQNVVDVVAARSRVECERGIEQGRTRCIRRREGKKLGTDIAGGDVRGTVAGSKSQIISDSLYEHDSSLLLEN